MTPVLEADRLFRFFHVGEEETLALRGVTLAVEPGELVAVTGPSGSGKSTLLACLAGLDEPDGGTVKVTGKVMSRRPETERAALRARAIGMLFQSANLFEHLSLDRNLALSQSLAGRPDRERRARRVSGGWSRSSDGRRQWRRPGQAGHARRPRRRVGRCGATGC